MAEVNCEGRTVREVNADIKQRIQQGDTDILVQNPGGRHNLAPNVRPTSHRPKIAKRRGGRPLRERTEKARQE